MQTVEEAAGFPAGLAPLHFAYSVGGSCAAGWTRIAQLITRSTFRQPSGTDWVDITDPYDPPLTFSSGPSYTFHGDLIYANNGIFGELMNRCLNGDPPHYMDYQDAGGCPMGAWGGNTKELRY